MAAEPTYYTYATEEIQKGIVDLAIGTTEIEEIVANLKFNVELNFENWGGGSKEEFTRVHTETADHIFAIAGWLNETKANIEQMLRDAVAEDGENAQLFSNS
ncbi:hypothetical protein AB0C77_13805 [Streptomyces sp. NPDC048629]|uniref:hypothetical protein n=1 Tax=Streptomyces sp. NPDC048629 TaxID=3154824 RepID=UPI003422446F